MAARLPMHNLSLAVDREGGSEGEETFAHVLKRQASSLPFIKTVLFAIGNPPSSKAAQCEAAIAFCHHKGFLTHSFLKRIFCHSGPANFVVSEKSNTTWRTIKMEAKIKTEREP